MTELTPEPDSSGGEKKISAKQENIFGNKPNT
jgi:hypothetical protein